MSRLRTTLGAVQTIGGSGSSPSSTIIAILVAGILVSRSLPGYTPSPIAARLAAAAIVTVCVAIAKLVRGIRAAAVTGVVGTLIAVVLLIAFG